MFVGLLIVGGATAFGAFYGLVRLVAWVWVGFSGVEDTVLRGPPQVGVGRMERYKEEIEALLTVFFSLYASVFVGIAVLAAVQRVTRLYVMPLVMLRGWLLMFALPLAIAGGYSAWEGIRGREFRQAGAGLALGVMGLYLVRLSIWG